MRVCEIVDPTDLSCQLAKHLPGASSPKFLRWTKGRSVTALPWLQIIEEEIGGSFHYLTSGASQTLDCNGYGTEFCFISKNSNEANVELLAMVAFYHSLAAHRLGVGHTMKIGRPVADLSHLDRLLISLPYPYGPEFEYVHSSNDRHIRVLWALPISESEEKYCHEFGLENLETRFEECAFDYADPLRPLVV